MSKTILIIKIALATSVIVEELEFKEWNSVKIGDSYMTQWGLRPIIAKCYRTTKDPVDDVPYNC